MAIVLFTTEFPAVFFGTLYFFAEFQKREYDSEAGDRLFPFVLVVGGVGLGAVYMGLIDGGPFDGPDPLKGKDKTDNFIPLIVFCYAFATAFWIHKRLSKEDEE